MWSFVLALGAIACQSAGATPVLEPGSGLVPELNEQALKHLVGNTTLAASVHLANVPEQLLSDRILDGFEAAGKTLTTAEGKTLMWGFKYKEANLQSVIINDASGQLALAAAVDDVPDLSTGNINSISAYQEALKRRGLRPHIVVVARDKTHLETEYPLFARWLEARLLGFHTSCEQHPLQCALLPNIQLPVDAYITAEDGNALTKVPLPDVPAAILLEDFTR